MGWSVNGRLCALEACNWGSSPHYPTTMNSLYRKSLYMVFRIETIGTGSLVKGSAHL